MEVLEPSGLSWDIEHHTGSFFATPEDSFYVTVESDQVLGNGSQTGVATMQYGVDSALRCVAERWGDLTFIDEAAVETRYDSDNNVTEVIQSIHTSHQSGRIQHLLMTYGPHGNLLTQKHLGDNYYAVQNSYFDASKYFQKQRVTDALGRVSEFDYFDKYDTSGNRGGVKWMRDARYGTTGQQNEYTYNSYGQKLTETNLNDVVTEYTYGDPHGNLTQVVQDPGAGKLNRTTTMAYDAAGRISSATDPKAQTSSFTFNAVGQPVTAQLPGETVTYSYGGNGRTESVTDNRGTITLTYHPGTDLVASVTDPVTGGFSYSYDLAGAKTAMTLPGGGQWQFKWNYLNCSRGDGPDKLQPRLEQIVDDQGRIVNYNLDNFGGLDWAQTNITYSGGSPTSYLKTSYGYDLYNNNSHTRQRVVQVSNRWHWQDAMSQWQSKVLVQNNYTYDNARNRTANALSDWTGPIRTETYGYDELRQLASVNYGDGQTQGFTLDPMGNRLTKTDSVNGNDTNTYNAANMLLTRNGAGYTYDANGNTLTGGGRTLTWDGQNRLTQCVFNGTTTTHTYGNDGLRRRTVQGSTTTDFVLDGSSVVRSQVNGVWDRTWLQGMRGPEYERVGSNAPSWYLYDALGSVLGLVDSSGNLTSVRKYDVYGAVRALSGESGTKHKWVGSLGHPSEEETGLVYMQARYYDPVAGRFASEDPARDGTNWFAYCRNAPVAAVDPTGRESREYLDRWADWLEEKSKWHLGQAKFYTTGAGAYYSLAKLEEFHASLCDAGYGFGLFGFLNGAAGAQFYRGEAIIHHNKARGFVASAIDHLTSAMHLNVSAWILRGMEI